MESSMFAGASRHTLLATVVIGFHLLLGWVLTAKTVAHGHATATNALEVTFFLSETPAAEPSLKPDPPLRVFPSPPALLPPTRIEEESDPAAAMAITIPLDEPRPCERTEHPGQLPATSKPCATILAPSIE